jgi:hypothetical protein
MGTYIDCGFFVCFAGVTSFKILKIKAKTWIDVLIMAILLQQKFINFPRMSGSVPSRISIHDKTAGWHK